MPANWPSTPGVPVDADKHGAHMLRVAGQEPMPFLWNCVGRGWISLSGESWHVDFVERNWEYIGPCTPPATQAVTDETDPFEVFRTGLRITDAGESSGGRIVISFPDVPTLHAAHKELIAALRARQDGGGGGR